MEIKFRALRKDGNGWVYGEKLTIGNYVFMVPLDENINEFIVGFDKEVNMPIINTKYSVIPESVGQFIGIRDKDSVEVYSRDICKVQLPMGGFWGDVKTEKVGFIEYNEDICGFIIRWKWSKNQHQIQLNCDLDIKIIGNIYENPELLTK